MKIDQEYRRELRKAAGSLTWPLAQAYCEVFDEHADLVVRLIDASDKIEALNYKIDKMRSDHAWSNAEYQGGL